MVINRGSFSNFDSQALDITTGVSQIKAFNISNVTDTPYQFNSSGLMLGWGLRNNVGIAEEPVTGGIYSVENSADQVTRAVSQPLACQRMMIDQYAAYRYTRKQPSREA